MSVKAWELREALAGLDDEALVVVDYAVPGHKFEQQIEVDSVRKGYPLDASSRWFDRRSALQVQAAL